MTTLDARARSAAHAIHAGVAEFTPAASFDVVVVRQQRWRTLRAGFAGAAAALAVVVAGIAVTPAPTPEVADIPTTIVEPTVPQPAPEVIVPIVPDTTEAPETTTTMVTTTTAAPVTTTTEADTTPPHLEITAPKNDERFEVDVIEFSGVTEPGATVFAGRYEADVDGDGNWSIVLILSPGANGARFVATDAAGNQAEARVTVHYDAPAPTTTKAPKEIEFTAYNVYGSCEETPPFDVYWGTAPPGTPIYVESAYGSGSTVSNAEGDWEVKVYFPEAPAEKVFNVKVKNDRGQKFYFEFIHWV
ncbi:MAG: hypothetical protein QNJ75_05285 [Acidimicrobiia bacterium]|nr:hypothetical protein [Acidimicrobiia bacterium]